MTEPLVSIIVPVRNGARYLPAALDSVLRQTMGDFEAIVIDDHSSDDSAEIAAGFAARDKRFKLTRSSQHGVSSARNAGLAISRGKFIAFLDSDDILPEPSLAARLKGLKASGASLVAGRWRVIDPAGRDLGLSMGRTNAVRRFASAFDLSAHIGATLGEAELMRSIKFHPDHRNGEDWEYLVNLLRAGAVLHPLDADVLRYRWRPQSAVSADIEQHAEALSSLLESFAGERGWHLDAIKPRQLALYYDLALKLVLYDADVHALERAARRCDALAEHSEAWPAQIGIDEMWVAGVRTYLKPMGSRDLAEQVCARVSGILQLAERMRAHRVSAMLRMLVDQALDAASPAAA